MKFKWNAVVIALLLAVAAPVSALPENGLKFVETADGRQSVEMMPSLAPVLSKAPAKPAAVVPSNSVPSFGSVSSPTGAGMQGIRPLWIVEKEAIEYAIEQCGDNIPLAAACLGVSASTIYRKKKSWVSGGEG